jgi:hypothetical protein
VTWRSHGGDGSIDLPVPDDKKHLKDKKKPVTNRKPTRMAHKWDWKYAELEAYVIVTPGSRWSTAPCPSGCAKPVVKFHELTVAKTFKTENVTFASSKLHRFREFWEDDPKRVTTTVPILGTDNGVTDSEIETKCNCIPSGDTGYKDDQPTKKSIPANQK